MQPTVKCPVVSPKLPPAPPGGRVATMVGPGPDFRAAELCFVRGPQGFGDGGFITHALGSGFGDERL